MLWSSIRVSSSDCDGRFINIFLNRVDLHIKYGYTCFYVIANKSMGLQAKTCNPIFFV